MKVLHTAAEVNALPTQRRRAVVMTMGALHEGHLALVRAAREHGETVLVTIFVNPLQFNDAGDLERYPRTLNEDVALLEAEGVAAVFAPAAAEVYPHGQPSVTVSAGEIGRRFEGEHRPGHFDGVLTVVLKLMHLTRPDVALFGQKDAQQLIAIRAMVRDLNVPVEIIGVPTVRDDDGLALSSRNRHLSAGERGDAVVLSRALRAAADRAAGGATLGEVLQTGRALVEAAGGVDIDYFDALDPADASAVTSDYRGEVIIAVAARVGATRLIDNVTARIG